MDLRTQVIASLAHRLVKLRGTQESFTVELEDVFVQAASYDGDAVLVEITGDRFLAVGRSLTIDQHDELLRLNFMRPTDDMPNWWIGIEDGHDRALFAAARSAVTALIEIHGVSIEALTVELPVYRFGSAFVSRAVTQVALTAGEGQPVRVETVYGEVLLYPNGYATLNGACWAEQPLQEWVRLGDGRISVQLAVPAGDYFPNVGFVRDAPDAIAVLRGVIPSRDEQEARALRMALAENYALTCIATGSLAHEALFNASLELELDSNAIRPSEIVGWDRRHRMEAARNVISAYYQLQSADNAREFSSDEENTWKAIQASVRFSPWREDFDFEIIVSEPPGRLYSWPKVQVQRVYY